MSRGESAAVKRLIKSILNAKATHYEVLGVDEDASVDEIRTEYRDLARTVHPDKGGDAAAFKKLANAKDVLLDHNARTAYDLELRAAREPAPAEKPKKKPAAKKPAKRAEPPSPPERASPPAKKPAKRARAAEPEPEPECAPVPYRGACTCPILAIEIYPLTAAKRLRNCPAGDTDRHSCSCYQLRQTFQGTEPCRFGGAHDCVCATTASSRFVARKSTAVCRAAKHECACLHDGHLLCKATKHACSCRHSGIASCRATKHECACVVTKNPAACLATKHDCACDALSDCFFAGPRSCRAARHACVCAKAGAGACRAETGHACVCKDLEKNSGGLFSAPSTSSCMARTHACLCAWPHTRTGVFKTNALCRAPGQTLAENFDAQRERTRAQIHSLLDDY